VCSPKIDSHKGEVGLDTKSESSILELDPVKAEQELNLVRYKRALARRNFLKNVGLASAGIAAGAVIQGCSSGTSSGGGGTVMAAGPREADVLNFALNLEYLEAEFYSVAVTGATLASSVTGGTSTATGGAKVTFTDPTVAAIAAEILKDEMLHVQYLRTALGAMAVAEPAINLNALGIGFASQAQFLTLARAFEIPASAPTPMQRPCLPGITSRLPYRSLQPRPTMRAIYA
jgi:hypothetical protein